MHRYSFADEERQLQKTGGETNCAENELSEAGQAGTGGYLPGGSRALATTWRSLPLPDT